MTGLPPIFFDKDGLIVHKNMDGGDTAQREGWYWFGVWIRDQVLQDPWGVARALTFPAVMALLEPATNGVFYRHPKLAPWNNPFDKKFGFSRDQMLPLVASLGLATPKEALERLWQALPQDPLGGTKHTFNGEWLSLGGKKLVYTGDIVGPMALNLFDRAFGRDPTGSGSTGSVLGEVELLTNVAIRLQLAETDRDDTGDDLNLIVLLVMAMLRYESTISRTARDLYRTRRAPSYGSYLDTYRSIYGIDPGVPIDEVKRRMEKGISSGWKEDAGVSPVFGAIRWYHREETGANPLLAELYKPIVAKYFSRSVDHS